MTLDGDFVAYFIAADGVPRMVVFNDSRDAASTRLALSLCGAQIVDKNDPRIRAFVWGAVA